MKVEKTHCAVKEPNVCEISIVSFVSTIWCLSHSREKGSTHRQTQHLRRSYGCGEHVCISGFCLKHGKLFESIKKKNWNLAVVQCTVYLMLQIWQTGQGSRVLMENSSCSLVEKKWLNSILLHWAISPMGQDENPKHLSSSIFHQWVAI